MEGAEFLRTAVPRLVPVHGQAAQGKGRQRSAHPAAHATEDAAAAVEDHAHVATPSRVRTGGGAVQSHGAHEVPRGAEDALQGTGGQSRQAVS